MKNYLEKISLWIIYVGLGLSFFSVLLVDSRFFYPYIFTKALIFRSAVEIMLLAYLFLIYKDRKYLPKFNLLSIFLVLFVIVSFIASIFGIDFNLSFWGDVERSEGLLLWLHLLFYFIILFGTLNSKRKWENFFDISIVVSFLLSLFALAQIIGIESILNTTGQRVAATIGNPAFLAAYLLFNLAFAIYFFIRRPAWYFRLYYAVISLFFIFIIFQTETRGAVLGLIAGLGLAVLLWLFKTSSRIIKNSIIIGLIVVIAAGFLIYFNRNSSFIANNPTLSRLTTISLNDVTTRNRLVTWQAAWQAFIQRPILGYGMENFTYVFDKNFPPVIYQDEGSQVWFDHAHNVFIDRMVMTGVIGLLVYLSIFVYIFYYFFKKYFKNENTADSIVFISLIVAFLIQDLFVFESISNYIILFFTLAFFGFLINQDKQQTTVNVPKFVFLSVLIVYALVLAPILYYINIKPAQVNAQLAVAMQLSKDTANFLTAVEQFKKPLESGILYGLPEYRLQFIQFIDDSFANLGQIRLALRPILDYADNEVEKQIEQQPNNAKNYLLAMRHYNYTFASLPDKKFERLDKALTFFPKLQELSPTRPHIYQEAGYNYLYFYRNYKDQGDDELAQKSAEEAEKYFNQALDLNPAVVESYNNLIMLYLNEDDNDKIQAIIDKMDQNSVEYKDDRYLSQLINLSVSNTNYYWAEYFVKQELVIHPNDPDWITKLALAQALQGKNKEAIQTANALKEIDPSYVESANFFIQQVNEGKYKN